MGFKSDQFYNVQSFGIGRTDDDPDGNRNPKFAFPGPVNGTVGQDGKWKEFKVQRGFMRVLTQINGSDNTYAAEKWANKQLFFQFNPQTIRRSVGMRSDFMNPLLQDPGQFILPVPGNANFTFDIMFDRSFELNRSTDVESFVAQNPPGVDGQYADEYNDDITALGPGQIGVLADMQVLDQIVGQGISKDMINFIMERGKIIYSQQQAAGATTTTDEEGNETTTVEGPAWDEDTVNGSLNSNVGNQAFLIPNPVRVVFSSLFMVDGYVQSMDVAYVKFTESMVPMQVVVSLTMTALYLGYAKKETALTIALRDATVAATPTADSPESTSSGESRKAIEDFLASMKFQGFKIQPLGSAGSYHSKLSEYEVVNEFGRTDQSGVPFGSSKFTDPFQYDWHYTRESSNFMNIDEQFFHRSSPDLSSADAGVNLSGKKNPGPGYFPGIGARDENTNGHQNTKWVWGFTGLPDKVEDDPLYQKLGTGATDLIKGIRVSWNFVCQRNPLGRSTTLSELLELEDSFPEDSYEKRTKDPWSIEVLKYSYDSASSESPEGGLQGLWKRERFHNGTTVKNEPSGASLEPGFTTGESFRRFFVPSNIDEDNWYLWASQALLRPDSTGQLKNFRWKMDVQVDFIDKDNNTLIYKGSSGWQSPKLDDSPNFNISLSIDGAGASSGPPRPGAT